MTLGHVWFVASLMVFIAGCGCGVGPVPTRSSTASVESDGTVTFDPISVGRTETFSIPVRESADTDETIVSARANGDFDVLSTFPIYVPRGSAVTIEVAFTPTRSGMHSSVLELDTAKMGTSRVAMKGHAL